MSAFGYTRYGQQFGVAIRDGGARISDKLLTATDRLAVALFEAGNCAGLEKNYIFLYPFVGGTQVAHSINLADPSKYRIQFDDDTTVTHNANGITGPGNVALFPFEDQSVDGCAGMFGLYQRSGVSSDQIDMICQLGSVVHGIICRRATYGDTIYWNGINSAAGYTVVANTNPQGFYSCMRSPDAWNGAAASAQYGYKNGTNVTSLAGGSRGNAGTWYLFSGNSHNIAFCFVTKSWLVSGMPWGHPIHATMYGIIQKFQTACSRQV
jgi:hypothetical protein